MLESNHTMLSLPHAAVGASIAALVPNPTISIPLAFVSHFLSDYLPHWNPHLDTEIKKHKRLTPLTIGVAATDFLSAIFFAGFIALTSPDFSQSYNLFFSSLAAILPDLLEAPHYLLDIKVPFVDKLITHQGKNQNHVPFWPGILTQVIVFALCLTILL